MYVVNVKVVAQRLDLHAKPAAAVAVTARSYSRRGSCEFKQLAPVAGERELSFPGLVVDVADPATRPDV